MSIYTVTLIDSRDETKISKDDVSRCIGYYSTSQESCDAVKSNRGEMHELRYNYAVVEEVPSGVWRLVTGEIWFAWSKEEERWIQCKKPQKYRQFANVSGFSMG